MVNISVGPYLNGFIVEALYPSSQRISTYVIADSSVALGPTFTRILAIPRVP